MSRACFTLSVPLIGCRGQQTSCVRAVLDPVLLRLWSVRANPKNAVQNWRGQKKKMGRACLRVCASVVVAIEVPACGAGG